MNLSEKQKILIVDDTPANIDVLGSILMPDYDISVAVNGPMALDIIESGTPPDLILLDIMMPDMDGYEVARRLKHNEKTCQIPVIFVTAKIQEEDEAFGFKIGGVDYIRKPVNPSVTLARIKSQLELKSYRDQLAGMVEESTSQVEISRKLLADRNTELSMAEDNLRDSKASAHKNHVYFRELFMNSPHGIILVGPDHQILNANKSFSHLVGFPIEEIIGKKASEFSVPQSLQEEHKGLIEKALGEKTISMETRCFHKNGYSVHVSALAYAVKIKDRVQGVFVFYENISQRKLFEEKLKHQAYHDSLTGIPNRLLFSERLDFAIDRQRRERDFRFAVLLIDLDRFKCVNDSLGHQAGDELLKAVTREVQKQLRADDTLARLGGDEFALILYDIKGRTEVTAIANRIRKAVEKSFVIDRQEVHISASIGIVMETEQYKTANLLLRDADLAMYHAKDAGKAQFQFFSREMHRELMHSITLERDLRKAVDQNHLTLFFQPIVEVSTGKLQGFEALVRWKHPELGMLPPDQFIPIAEETGIIIPMGEWITESAVRQLALWQQEQDRALTMSINISIRQFLQHDFTASLCRITEKYGVTPSHIKLEFTESLLMEHTHSAVTKLEELRKQGFMRVIDDFGTGYSSLSYLLQFPIDQIKIDRSFVDSMGEKKSSLEIVRLILSLSKNLGLTTVAEGVETREQLSTLNRLQCEQAQGYLFSKPLPPDQVFPFRQIAGQDILTS